MVSLYGYYWKWRRFGGAFERALQECKLREHYSHKQWETYQKDALIQLIHHAREHVPYYTRNWSVNTLQSHADRDLSEILNQFPILEKEMLRKYGKTELLSRKRYKGHFYSSSGSTGTPTSIYYSYQFHRLWSALFEARIRHWAGLDRNMARGMIGGRRVVPEGKSKPPFYRYNAAENQVYFSAYHIAPEHIENYVHAMRQYKIEYMTGYAASNFILAKMIREVGLQAPQLKAVITSSEKLTPEMRKLFEEVYGCKTYDSYSGVEACGLISECEHGSLHVSPDAGIIEILDEKGNPVNPGETGEAICTGLLNFDQPLIRYRIGDQLTLAKNQNCPCGRAMPVISAINGRTEDVIKGPDGREMVRFHGVFIDLPEVRRGQIVQESLSEFIIYVECGATLSESSRQKMMERMRSQLGNIQVHVKQTDRIPLGPNGKFKAVISRINQTTK